MSEELAYTFGLTGNLAWRVSASASRDLDLQADIKLILGIELWSSGLQNKSFIYRVISLTPTIHIFKTKY